MITRKMIGLIAALLLIVGVGGCKSDEFADAPSVEAPDEPVDGPSARGRSAGKLPEGGANQKMPRNHPPVGGGSAGSASPDRPSAPAPSAGGPGGGLPVGWEAPDGWKKVEPSSSMRAAQYRLDGEGGAATLAIYHFGSGGGGVKANIDRWIGQFEGPDGGSLREEATTKVRRVDEVKVHLVEVTGTYSPGAGMGAGQTRKDQRMLGAIAEAPGGLVFFKLLGPKETVAAHEKEFDTFVSSFRPGS